MRDIAAKLLYLCRWKDDGIEGLKDSGIQVGVFIGPVIPGLNNQEISALMEATSRAGADFANYSMIRLNGDLSVLFRNWLQTHFPDRLDKIWNQICSLHGGKVSDSAFGKRMRGEGAIADAVRQLFHITHKRFYGNDKLPELNRNNFRRLGNYSLFN